MSRLHGLTVPTGAMTYRRAQTCFQSMAGGGVAARDKNAPAESVESVAGLATRFGPKAVRNGHTVLPGPRLTHYNPVIIRREIRSVDQIIESYAAGTDRPQKVQNQDGRVVHLFECATFAPRHPRQRATIRRQDPLRVKHFTKKLGRPLRQRECISRWRHVATLTTP